MHILRFMSKVFLHGDLMGRDFRKPKKWWWDFLILSGLPWALYKPVALTVPYSLRLTNPINVPRPSYNFCIVISDLLFCFLFLRTWEWKRILPCSFFFVVRKWCIRLMIYGSQEKFLFSSFSHCIFPWKKILVFKQYVGWDRIGKWSHFGGKITHWFCGYELWCVC